MCLVADIPFILLMLKLKEYYRYLVLTQNYVCEIYVRINKLNVYRTVRQVRFYCIFDEKLFSSNRKNAKFESKGQRYEMGDFVIKIGSVVLGANTSFKGILVEVSNPRFFASFKITLYSAILEAKNYCITRFCHLNRSKKKKVYI